MTDVENLRKISIITSTRLFFGQNSNNLLQSSFTSEVAQLLTVNACSDTLHSVRWVGVWNKPGIRHIVILIWIALFHFLYEETKFSRHMDYKEKVTQFVFILGMEIDLLQVDSSSGNWNKLTWWKEGT